MKIDHQEWKQRHLNGDGDQYCAKRIAQRSLQMQALELSCKRRLEESTAVVRTFEFARGFSLTPKQTLGKAEQPGGARRRVWSFPSWMPGADCGQFFQQQPGEYDNCQHRNEGQLKRRIEEIIGTPRQQHEPRAAESIQ